MKTQQFLEDQITMLSVSLILVSFVVILLAALVWAITKREQLTPLNDAIDLKDNYIRKIDKKNRYLKDQLIHLISIGSVMEKDEIIKRIRSLINHNQSE